MLGGLGDFVPQKLKLFWLADEVVIKAFWCIL